MKTILLLRPEGLNAADAAFFESRGYDQQIVTPISSLRLRSIGTEDCKAIQAADWIFFTSQTPVKSVLAVSSSKVKIAVIGRKTAREVEESGCKVDFISPVETKEDFVAAWRQQYQLPQKIVYPKSNLAGSFPLQAHEFIAYDNLPNRSSFEKISVLLKNQEIDAVYLTSPSNWQRFYQIYQDFSWQSLTLIALGNTTYKAIEDTGCQVLLKA